MASGSKARTFQGTFFKCAASSKGGKMRTQINQSNLRAEMQQHSRLHNTILTNEIATFDLSSNCLTNARHK